MSFRIFAEGEYPESTISNIQDSRFRGNDKKELMYKNTKQQFEDELKEIRDAGTWKDEGVIEGKQGAEIVVDGKKLLNFCGNNYLGLASSDELAQAAIDGVQKYGFGMASVRFICGTSTIHKDLEKEVA